MWLKKALIILALCLSQPVSALEDLYQRSWLSPTGELASVISYPEVVNQIYAEQNFHLIWYQPEASQRLEFAIRLLKDAGISDFFAYRSDTLEELRKTGRWYAYDILATDTFLNYQIYSAQVTDKGKDWLYGRSVELEYSYPSPASVERFIWYSQESRLEELVTSYYGTPGQINDLVLAVELLRQGVENRVPAYRQKGLAREGDILPDKERLIARIHHLGLDTSHLDVSSGEYDADLVSLIIQLQEMHGIKTDGIIGKETLFWINLSFKNRLRTIALNTERARLIPKNRDNTIIVNLPSFQLFYWHQGEAKFTSKVIVGRKKRKTPLLNIHMDTLILNPSWNVPMKLVRKDIIPLIKKDPTYIERMNFKILKNWFSGEEIDPQTIDWENLDPNTFSYNMTQAPGKSNALGRYKFNTPNPRAIYLHDTPSQHLFDNPSRAYSSGCIRVQNADEFAHTLLKLQGIELPALSEEVVPKSRWIAFKERIPVHILYQTAWIEDGLIQYRKDIYGYDSKPIHLTLTKN